MLVSSKTKLSAKITFLFNQDITINTAFPFLTLLGRLTKAELFSGVVTIARFTKVGFQLTSGHFSAVTVNVLNSNFLQPHALLS